MLTAAGIQVITNFEYHLQQASIFFRKPVDFIGPNYFSFPNTQNILIPWFHLLHVLATGTGQSTTFWMTLCGTHV